MKTIITKKQLFTLLFLGIISLSMQVKALTYNVTVPVGTEYCYIAGGFNDWSVSANPMTKVDDTHFTVDIATALTTDEYQYLSGPAWAYEQANASGTATSQSGWSANDVVVNWKFFYTTTPTIKVKVPTSISSCYIVTSLDSWTFKSASECALTLFSSDESEKVFTITLTGISDPTALRYRFSASPDWTNEQTNPSTEFAWVYGTVNTVNTFAGIVSGVSDNKLESIKIKSINQTIVLENINSTVEVFDVTGNCIAKQNNVNNFTTKRLNSGVYIVKMNGFTQKVVVK